MGDFSLWFSTSLPKFVHYQGCFCKCQEYEYHWKLSENEPANTSANVFVSTQLRTDNCCGPKREKLLWDFRSGRHRITASSEVDCSSMYGVAPVWTFCVGRENGVAASSTRTETCESQVRLVFHFGRTNMSPESKRTQPLDKSPSQPLSMPLTQQNNRKTKYERTPHQDKRHRRNWIPTQFAQKQARFFSKEHV